MVTLTDLPEEVIIIIIRTLDLSSIHSLYDVCKQTRSIVQMTGIVKIFNMSLNTMATMHSLKSKFFNDLAGHLQELNMCGVSDVKVSSLLLTMKKLKSLKTLDISYTNINMVDFIKIYTLCPTIKNVTLNLVFGKIGMSVLSNKFLTQCQDLFQNFENVHFVGSVSNILYSNVPYCILEKAKLNTLKFSITECDYVSTSSLAQNQSNNYWELNFNNFDIYLVNWKDNNISYQIISSIPALARLNFFNYEYIIILMISVNKFTVYISPIFKDFFYNNFGIDAECTTDFQMRLFGNVSIMLWEKNINKFDNVFFSNLLIKIKPYFPKLCTSGFLVPQNYDWFYIVPQCKNLDNKESHKLRNKKRRIAPPNLILDYDDMFREKQKIKLSFMFNENIKNTISLKSNCNYLKKITFLSLSGLVRYNSDFFNILMHSCCNLITLNIEAPSVFPCASLISRALPSSTCIKNLRLVDRRIDFKVLLLSLSKTETLENIYIIEDCLTEYRDLADPSIVIEKCDKLYNFYIEAPLSECVRAKKLQKINVTKKRCKRYASNIVLHAKSVNQLRYWYDPFVSVFNLNPIKPLL